MTGSTFCGSIPPAATYKASLLSRVFHAVCAEVAQAEDSASVLSTITSTSFSGQLYIMLAMCPRSSPKSTCRAPAKLEPTSTRRRRRSACKRLVRALRCCPAGAGGTGPRCGLGHLRDRILLQAGPVQPDLRTMTFLHWSVMRRRRGGTRPRSRAIALRSLERGPLVQQGLLPSFASSFVVTVGLELAVAQPKVLQSRQLFLVPLDRLLASLWRAANPGRRAAEPR